MNEWRSSSCIVEVLYKSRWIWMKSRILFEQISCVLVHPLVIDWFPLFWWLLGSKLSLGWFSDSVICFSTIKPRAKLPRITSPPDWGFWSFWKTLFCFFPPRNSSDPLRFGLILFVERFVSIPGTSLDRSGLTGRSNRSDRSGTSTPVRPVWPARASGLTGQIQWHCCLWFSHYCFCLVSLGVLQRDS